MNRARAIRLMRNEMRSVMPRDARVRITGAKRVGPVDVVTYTIHYKRTLDERSVTEHRWAVYAPDSERCLAGGIAR